MTSSAALPTDRAERTYPELPRRQRRAWRAFKRNRLAILGGVIALAMFGMAVFAPVLAPHDPAEQNAKARFEPPSSDHWLGTDQYGRDQLSRLIHASRISLSVGVASVAILITIGVTLGAIGGYGGGAVDMTVMRIVDIMMSMPRFFLILAMVALFGASIGNTILVIGLTSWMGTTRLVRGQILGLREQDYVMAALSIGVPSWRIILFHLIPNTLAAIIVQATLFLSFAILIETSLSYLGLGAQPPDASWGNMLSGGKLYMARAWWLTLFPGLAISITVLAFNMLGDGLRDAFDPRMHR